MSKPSEPYDPQKLDNYESLNKEINRNGYAHIIGYSAIFAPFGWFIANGKDKRVRAMAMFTCAFLGAYCGHCIASTSARERLEKRRWFRFGFTNAISTSFVCSYKSYPDMLDTEEQVHAFENRWVLLEQYYIDNKTDRCKGYENSFEKLCLIDTVESFWKFWGGIPAIADVLFDGTEKIVERTDSRNMDVSPRKCRIIGQCIFKEGIEPKYEDPHNANGGHITCVFLKEDHDVLSVFWEAVVMSLIGETLDSANFITGARVIDKSNINSNQINHRVEIWFNDWANEELKSVLLDRVKHLMVECGCISTDITISYNDTSKWASK